MYGISRAWATRRAALLRQLLVEADQVLRPAFVQTIAEQPLAILTWRDEAAQHSARATGTYSGEFDQARTSAGSDRHPAPHLVQRYTSTSVICSSSARPSSTPDHVAADDDSDC